MQIGNVTIGKGLIAAGVSVGAVFILGMLLYSTFNNIDKDAERREAALTAQYLDNQNELSKFISGFNETFGVAEVKADKLNEVLENAMKGRYESGSSAAVPGAAGNTALFSAMVEAYPDLSGLDSYDRVIDYVQAGRESYKQQQTKLLDMIREYDTWRRSGLIHQRLVILAGHPGDGLRAQIAEKVVTGEVALEQMRLIVTTSDTRAAYTTGTMEPLATSPIGKE
jgi:hypothetical protein